MRITIFLFFMFVWTNIPIMNAMKCSDCDPDDQKGNAVNFLTTAATVGTGALIIKNGTKHLSTFFKSALTPNDVLASAIIGGTLVAIPIYYIGHAFADYSKGCCWKDKCQQITCQKSPSDKFIYGMSWLFGIGFVYTTLYFYGKAPAKEAPLVLTGGLIASMAGAIWGVPSFLRIFKL